MPNSIPNQPMQPMNNVSQPQNQMMGSQIPSQPAQPMNNVSQPQNQMMGNQIHNQNMMSQQPVNPVTSQFNQPNVMTPQQVIQSTTSNQNGNKSNKKLPLIIGMILAIIAVIGIVVFLLLTGKEKTMVCTLSDQYLGLKTSAEAEIKFKNDRVEKIEMDMTFDLGEYAFYKDKFIEALKKGYNEQNDDVKVDIDITSDDSHIYAHMEASSNNYGILGNIQGKKYEEVKESLESDGYTCK